MLRRVLLIALVLLLFPMMPALTPGAHAAASLPSYQLQYLGPGAPAAINNSGTVAGTLLSGNNYTPLVSTGGGAWKPLPVPPAPSAPSPTTSTTAA